LSSRGTPHSLRTGSPRRRRRFWWYLWKAPSHARSVTNASPFFCHAFLHAHGGSESASRPTPCRVIKIHPPVAKLTERMRCDRGLVAVEAACMQQALERMPFSIVKSRAQQAQLQMRADSSSCVCVETLACPVTGDAIRSYQIWIVHVSLLDSWWLAVYLKVKMDRLGSELH
jgi:hypothetical protein